VLEALVASPRVRRLLIDERCRPDVKLDAILEAADVRGITIERVPRSELDRDGEGRVHNGVVALADPLPERQLPELIDALLDGQVDDPLILLLDEVQYDQNLGAILRTADAAGVSAVVVPRRRGAGLSPVVARISMGGSEHVPLVRCAILEAMSLLHRAGFRLVGADDHAARLHTDVDLTGPLGLVMGGEDKGLTPPVRDRCDTLTRLPMVGHVPSLNVSVSAGVLLYERLRQLGAP
jgi:23S rRNA (guanosine2251-2'-O)-methyltransferase